MRETEDLFPKIHRRKGNSNMSEPWSPPEPPKTPSQVKEEWEWYNFMTREGGVSGAAKGAAVLGTGAAIVGAGAAASAGIAMAPVVVPVAVVAGIVGAITGAQRKR
jgi:hypothetical protein